MTATPPNRGRILVADDEEDIVRVAVAILGTRGYLVEGVHDGMDALRYIEEHHPDLVVTDLKMPGMSGMELIKRIRANPDIASTPVLVISSMGSEVDKPASFWIDGLKSDDFLAKPFDPLSLLGRVEYLMRNQDDIRARRSGDFEPPPSAAPDAPPATEVQWDDPAEVVRAFVMAWNAQDFLTEYEALSPEMLHGVNKNDYIDRRRKSYAAEGSRTRHNVIDAETLNVSTNVATVACLRDDEVNGISQRKDERYTMRKDGERWRIVNVRSRPLAFTVTE